MTDYIHPDDFDLLLKTTPYKVWMWLNQETKYESPWETHVDPPTLSPPEFLNRNPPPPEYSEEFPEINYTKTVFIRPTKRVVKPHPFDSDARFRLEEINYCYKEKEDRYASTWFKSVEEVIKIFIKSNEEGLTRVIGEYDSSWPELVVYMKQLRDALVKKFPVVGRENSVTSTTEPLMQMVDIERNKLLPRTEEGRKNWKKCYTLIKKQRKIYKKDYDDGASDNPIPSFDDIRDYLINKGEKKYSERTLRNIIKAGEKGWLK